jgi:hypothetical protein
VEDDTLVAAITSDLEWTREIGGSAGTALIAAWQHCRDRVAALDGTVNVQTDELEMTVTALIPLNPGSA